MDVEVKGLNQLLKKLDKLGANSGRVLNAAMLEFGDDICDAAKKAAPESSGALRDSIKVSSVYQDKVTIGTNVKYARYVEYGTGPLGDPQVTHTTHPFWRYLGKNEQWVTSHGNAPWPFMRTAFAMCKGKAGEIIKRSLERQLRETK